MTTRSEIIQANPIGEGLDSFRDTHALVPTDEGKIVADDERENNTAVDLLLAVQCLRASRLLPSKRGKGYLRSDLPRLALAVNSNYYDCERIKPLLDAVLNKQPDKVIWDAVYECMPPFRALSSFPHAPCACNTRSFANSTEHRKCIDVPNKIQCSKRASLLCSPFLRLPPEIRCMVYRILLRSERHVRMIQPPLHRDHKLCPNNLYPSILGACHLIYQEAHYVLYAENSFHAHRINENNHNAALIRRAKYRIGLRKHEDGQDEARKLADFLGFKRELRLIELEFGFDLIEDPSIYDLVRQAIQNHRHLRDVKILSPLPFSEIGWRHSWRLQQIVRDQALLLEWLGEN